MCVCVCNMGHDNLDGPQSAPTRVTGHNTRSAVVRTYLLEPKLNMAQLFQGTGCYDLNLNLADYKK